MRQVHYRFPSPYHRWLPYGRIGRQEAEYLMLYRLIRVNEALPWRINLQFVER